ncbi:16S RNA G1207 methylase RsmC [Salinarchaeum sp. Harcht-Bsk1]|uniref:methyltransferase n=1 Tax=Salinarchaeum sp. Harcht-Bsk1 TaxID=1333523 RepID=UPI00034229C7|nr:methyltransferase [Salinarchaeum sp. Harcht-Bsk1]AGN01919.1 16S RNA G1207 methylase RsmC [Salinarchaeum sp. Harcht-Bsk1]
MATRLRTLALEARTEGGPDRFEFTTADGVCSADAIRTAELLLAEVLWDRDPGNLLVPEANYGVVGTLLADVAASVTMTESSARATELCRRNARENGADAHVALLAELDSLGSGDGATEPDPNGPPFDVVAYAPKPYTPIAVGRQRIADAFGLLAPGGTCIVAAEPTTGLDRYRETLEVIGNCVGTVCERDGVAVIEARRQGAADPVEALDRRPLVEPRPLTPTVDGVDLELVSGPGLFAAGGLDHGTRLLLETLDVADGDRLLDVCCGYGPIGAFAAATADCSVVLTDDDRVATQCAECSLQRTDLAAGSETTVVTGNCTEAVADRTFDLVATNPPTHAGSGVLSELFAGIRDVLAPDGACLFVRHEALDLSGHLRGFDSVETVAAGEEHVVRRATP